jgi:hypothetical protein
MKVVEMRDGRSSVRGLYGRFQGRVTADEE